jgi:hypothetical protein
MSCIEPLECCHAQRTELSVVLTLPQDAGAISLLLPQSITEVGRFLALLLLFRSTALHQTENGHTEPSHLVQDSELSQHWLLGYEATSLAVCRGIHCTQLLFACLTLCLVK